MTVRARFVAQVLVAVAPIGALAWGCTDSDDATPPADVDAAFEASTTDSPVSADGGKDVTPGTDSPAPKDGNTTDVAPPEDTGVDAPVDADAGPPNGFFVDPVNGADTNAGTAAAPFKTIKKAADSIVSGQTIFLAEGTYDNTTQTTLSFNFTFPVFISGIGANASLIDFNAIANAFIFMQGGGVTNVKLKNASTAIDVEDGTFTATKVAFDNVGLPMAFKGNTTATVDNSAVANPFVNPPVTAFSATLLTEGGANVTYKGGTISGVSSPIIGMLARGHSTLAVSDLTIQNLPSHAVLLYDTAHLTLTNVTFTGCGLGTSSGIDKAVIAMGGQNTEAPTTTSLTLDTVNITNSTGPVIALTEYNLATTQTITLTNSHLDGTTGTFGYAIIVQNNGTPVGQTLTINSTNTTFKNHTAGGLLVPRPTALNITGGEISGNAGNGIEVNDATHINAIKVRGTTFDNNTGDAVTFAGAATSSFDLGKTGAGNAGGITFTNVPAGKSAVRLGTGITGLAVGNTWIPSTQGADAAGHYTTSPTVLTAATGAGKNVTLAGTSTLTVD